MQTLTKRQKQILDFIGEYIKKNSISPTYEEIKKRFRLSALSTVHQHVEALINKNYLIKNDNSSRSIEIKKTVDDFIQIPLKGTIAAGQPIEAIEERETIAVPKINLPKSSDLFALRVSGDSMIGENINDGDIVIIKSQSTADNGQKIVALIDNCEVTLKKIYKEKNRIRLQPANERMNPIYIKPKNLMVQGIVIDVIKNITPELQIEKKQTIQYKNLPLNQIICGDVIEEIKKLPDESCDVVVVDPPYNIGKDFGNNHDKRELKEYIAWCNEWINECIRVMKPSGTIFIYGFSEILAHLSVEISLPKRWLIWHYTNKNVASLNFWQRSHEAIICAWKEQPIFNRDEVREPYTEGFLNGAAGKVRAATIGRFSSSGKETIYNAHENGALPRDVLKIPALAGGAGMSERFFLCKDCNNIYSPKKLKKHKDHNIIKHPTQKPLELSRKLIQSAMPQKNGIVLVPFVGSGSECIAAKELGQSFIGFEINPEYIKIANHILDNTKYAPKLF